jgi:LysM repeat protein
MTNGTWLVGLLAFTFAGCMQGGGPSLPPLATDYVPPPPPAPAAAPRVPEGWKTYEVQPGDTLGRIARCRNVALPDLALANGIADPDHLLAGRLLHVPARNRCAFVARKRPDAGATPAGGAAAASPSSSPFASPLDLPAGAPGRFDAESAQCLLDAAEKRYRAADFDGAIAGAEAAQRALDDVSSQKGAERLRARSHALTAMAALGLEQREWALAELRTALALDPTLELSPTTTSPRVLELAREARAEEKAAAAR